MCSPLISLGASAAGGAYSTVGAYYAAQGEKTALKSQAALAEINARMSEMAAQQELRRGQFDYARERLRTADAKSQQRAAFAANGVALDSGSAVNVLTTTDLIGEVDANQAVTNAVMQAWGQRSRAVEYRNESLMKRSAAKSISPWMRAGSTLLTSAATVGRDYYDLKKAGAFEEKLPWQRQGNAKPSWMGGGTY